MAPHPVAKFHHLLAYGKINLALNVGEVRPDGYHEVEMVLHQVPVYDHLTFYPAPSPGIALETNLSFLKVDESNLIVKAYKAMEERFGLPGVRARLYKRIPVSAGMAGGSADAAMTIRGLNELFSLHLSLEEEMAIGETLGSDIPFCLMGGSALATGRGEVLEPFPRLPMGQILFVKPRFGVSTPYVYQHFDPASAGEKADIEALRQALLKGSLREAAPHMHNQLEPTVDRVYPVIREIREHLLDLGALASRMSGSGPTVFGIFDDPLLAGDALEKLRRIYPPSYRIFLTDTGLEELS